MPLPFASVEQRAQRRVGAVLRDKYVLHRVLGAGGMAAVYLGVHRNGNRVAIKVLHPEASADPDTRARFLREGYVANSIDHPGAVRALDNDTDDDGAVFLVMELLDGETLHARAKRLGGRLPLREALALGRDLLDVLAAAHDKGVVHRDVKPENLFLTTDRVLKVLDFGIARGGEAPEAGASALTRAGTAMGTPAFMPPEQALGRSRDVDARSDVWSVGATLFTLLSGVFVHEAETAGEVLVLAATVRARSLAEVAPQIPAPIVALIDRALELEREKRWPSARAMRDALDEACLEALAERVSPSAVGPVSSALGASPDPGVPTAAVYLGETHQVGVSSLGVGETQPVGASSLGPSSRANAVTTSRTSRESAATLPASSVGALLSGESADPPSPPRATVTEEPHDAGSAPGPPAEGPPDRGPRAGASPRPTERRGATVAVVLALLAGAALVVSRVRHPGGEEERPHVGEAPCFADTDCGAGFTCGSASRCVEARGAALAAPRCTENRACVAGSQGRPAICRKSDGVCVPLESEDCKVLAEPGDVENDATIWIGSMFPLSGADAAAYGDGSRDAVELARRDFAETVNGLPPARDGGPRRPLAVVSCDDAREPSRAAAHLVSDVRVPVVIGFHRSKEVADLAASFFTPRGVLALASNTATMLRTLPHAPGQPRLVWRTTVSSDMMDAPVAALVSAVIEPELRAVPRLLAPGEPLRVATSRVSNASGLGSADYLVATLRFNGKSVAENGDAFRQVAFADATEEAGKRAQAERVAAEIAAFRPHIVVNDMDGRLVPAVERAWPAGERFRPRYAGVSHSSAELLEVVRQHPELRKRLFSSDSPTSTPVVAKFVLRHNEVFPTKVTALDAVSAPYDAFYTAAYAIAAVGAEPVTGVALARAIPRLLPPQTPVDVGPAGIFQALDALGSGKGIDLVGTVTSLDFDLETGDATTDSAIFCMPGAPGSALEFVESGLIYRGRTGKLEGALRCP